MSPHTRPADGWPLPLAKYPFMITLCGKEDNLHSVTVNILESRGYLLRFQ